MGSFAPSTSVVCSAQVVAGSRLNKQFMDLLKPFGLDSPWVLSPPLWHILYRQVELGCGLLAGLEAVLQHTLPGSDSPLMA